MAKVKYKYNPATLTYEKIQLTLVDRLKTLMVYLLVGMFFAGIIIALAYTFLDSPKELLLKREIAQLRKQYELLSRDMQQLEAVLEDIENRDDNIYRVIFEAEPISKSVRKAGVGGINRYAHLKGYENSDIIIQANARLDAIAKRLYIQSKSYDEVIELARNKEALLAAIPAIQPVSNKDLSRLASGFGMRIDPIYKVPKFHWGMDFSAPVGTDIVATGDGRVSHLIEDRAGYGKHAIIDHGYGYQTLYAHMSSFAVRRGQKVRRGDVIGKVGNSGKSTGPHLHYEVIKDGRKVNPANFFFNDLTPEEYDLLLEISANANQSFD
jgi:murein DD-endopeptidase MepM/ murein hydrolase activator NlpD